MGNNAIPDYLEQVSNSSEPFRYRTIIVPETRTITISLLSPIGDLFKEGPVRDARVIRRAKIVGRLKTFNLFKPIFPGITHAQDLVTSQKFIPKEWREPFLGSSSNFPSIILPGTLLRNKSTGTLFFPALCYDSSKNLWQLSFTQCNSKERFRYGNEKRIAVFN